MSVVEVDHGAASVHWDVAHVRSILTRSFVEADVRETPIDLSERAVQLSFDAPLPVYGDDGG